MANVCTKCGNNLYGNKTKCPFCGEPIGHSSKPTSTSSKPSSSSGNLNSSSYNNTNPYSGYNNNQKSTTNYSSSSSYDSGSAGWGLLGFCVPIVGIILYLVWQNEKPNTAKVCLNGALISIVIGFILGLFQACASIAAY
jgi:hypothetical protein